MSRSRLRLTRSAAGDAPGSPAHVPSPDAAPGTAALDGAGAPPASADEPTVGERVARCREAAGLTQVELARRTGLAQSTLSTLEAGSKVRADTLVTIARALDMPVGAFFGDAANAVPGLAPEDHAFVLEFSQQSAGVRAQVRAYLRFVVEQARHVPPARGAARRKAS